MYDPEMRLNVIRQLNASALLLAHALIPVLAIALAGCASNGGAPKTQGTSNSSPDAQHAINTRLLQLDVMNFADRFSVRMTDSFDQLADASTTTAAKDMALRRKIDITTASFINAVNINPVLGMTDMLVMVRLIRLSCEERWFTNMFGENAQRLVAVLRVEEEDIWRLGGRYLTPDQLEELRHATDHWWHDHPDQRYVAMVRLSDFPEAGSAQSAAAHGPRSVFALLFVDPLAGIDPAVREVERSREAAERMFFYVQRMPLLLSWETEALSRRILTAPQVQQFVDSSAKFSTSTTRFADSSKSFADSVKQFPTILSTQRQQTLEQLAKSVATERDAAIRQSVEAISAEREAAVHQLADTVNDEREQILNMATTRVSAERDATITQLSATIQSQREGLLHDVESASNRSMDRLFSLVIVVILVAIGSTALAVLALRRRQKG